MFEESFFGDIICNFVNQSSYFCNLILMTFSLRFFAGGMGTGKIACSGRQNKNDCRTYEGSGPEMASRFQKS